jgi:DNA-binding transcriptional ArsR family regulator
VDVLDECKALSNETRLRILNWLKEPEANFPRGDTAAPGVCAGLIQQKSGASASTVSGHLAILQRAGFLQATRRGQWIYYRRDEARIRAFADDLHRNL